MAVEIARATDRDLFQVSICVTRSGQGAGPSLVPNVDLYHLNRQSRWDLGKFREFGSHCDAAAINLLHVHGRSSFLLVAFMKLAKFVPEGTKVLFHDHYGDVELGIPWPRRLRWALRTTEPYYVGVHERLRAEALENRLPAGRAAFIRNGIEFADFCDSPDAGGGIEAPPRGDGPVCIQISNLRPTKDILLLLQAFAILRESKWTLWLVGSFNDKAYTQEVRRIIEERGFSARVHLLGPRREIVPLLRQADLATLSSRSESGPLVLLEYLAAGLPIASTCVGSIGRYLDQQGVFDLAPPGNSVALAKEIGKLLKMEPERRKALGVEAREHVRARFDIREIMPLWYDAYEQALGT